MNKTPKSKILNYSNSNMINNNSKSPNIKIKTPEPSSKLKSPRHKFFTNQSQSNVKIDNISEYKSHNFNHFFSDKNDIKSHE